MELVLIIGLGIEWLVFSSVKLWPYRFGIIASNLALMSGWLAYSFMLQISSWIVPIAFVVLFRFIGLFKAMRSSVHQDYLRRVSRRTSLALGGLLLLVLLLQKLSDSWTVTASGFVSGLSFVAFCAGVGVLATTARNLQKTRHHSSKHYFSDKELPTVTVAIPARNETDLLASCIRSILANDYPKLEVIVLDDCSQDRTAEVIKDFAHDGVRFVQGDPPSDRWLAKNQAYEKLAKEASGDVILFCGVDVRVGPHTIRALVTSMLDKKRDMMSVLPFRIGGGVDTSIIQPLRYWWELALPRRAFNRPPVLSTCWLIKSKTLKKLGYFKGVSHNIVPERFFARELVKSDAYAFIRSDENLNVQTVKPVEAQLATAVRVRYPSLKKRPENILFLTLMQLLLLLPIIIVFAAFWTGVQEYTVLSLIASILLISTHYLIMSASHPVHSTLALFNYPFAVLTDVVISFVSMIQYERGKITWKGRNVCIPAMHIVESLPKVD